MHYFKLATLGLMSSLLMLAPSLAASSIGKALVDGKIVVLYDNKTWSYEDQASQDNGCQTLSDRVEFCVGSTSYQVVDSGSSELLAQFSKDDRNYAMIIEESVGSKDGMTLEFMRKAVIDNQVSAGVNKNDIITIDTTEGLVYEQNASFLAIATQLDGLKLVYAYTIIVSDKATYQLITYSIGTELSDEAMGNHKEFLDLVKIKFD